MNDKKYQTDIGGGGSRINILDPNIAARLNEEASDGDISTPAGQSMLVRAVVEEALRRPMSPKEVEALLVVICSGSGTGRRNDAY